MEYLHANQVVHRDLKPDNFLLDDKRIPQITDFGFAVLDKSPGTKSSSAGFMDRMFSSNPSAGQRIMCETVCGTADYVAPEVHSLAPKALYDAKSADIYAMGVSAFEMLNFTKPFTRAPDEPAFPMRDKALVALQTAAKFQFNPRVTLTKDCVAFLRALMAPSVRARPNVKAAKTHQWLKSAHK